MITQPLQANKNKFFSSAVHSATFTLHHMRRAPGIYVSHADIRCTTGDRGDCKAHQSDDKQQYTKNWELCSQQLSPQWCDKQFACCQYYQQQYITTNACLCSQYNSIIHSLHTDPLVLWHCLLGRTGKIYCYLKYAKLHIFPHETSWTNLNQTIEQYEVRITWLTIAVSSYDVQAARST